MLGQRVTDWWRSVILWVCCDRRCRFCFIFFWKGNCWRFKVFICVAIGLRSYRCASWICAEVSYRFPPIFLREWFVIRLWWFFVYFFEVLPCWFVWHFVVSPIFVLRVWRQVSHNTSLKPGPKRVCPALGGKPILQTPSLFWGFTVSCRVSSSTIKEL